MSIGPHESQTRALTFALTAPPLRRVTKTERFVCGSRGPVLALMLIPQDGPIEALAFSLDASRIVSGGKDGTVRVWNVRTGRQGRSPAEPWLREHPEVMAVAYSRMAGNIYAAGNQHFFGATVGVWDARRLAPFVDLQHDAPSGALAFAPDGTRLAVGYKDGSLRSRTCARLRPHRYWRPTDSGRDGVVVDDPKGRVLATASEDASIRFWER